MNVEFFKGLIFSLFVFFFSFVTINAQETTTELSLSDKKQIIETLLKEKFGGSPEKMILISTANLSDDLQKDFPIIKNKKIQLISAELPKNAETCAYEFGEFQFIDRFVSVTFGNCSEGLAYDFKKFGDKWKSVGLTVTKEIFY